MGRWMILGKVRQRIFDHPLSCLVKTWLGRQASPVGKGLKLGKAPGNRRAVEDPNRNPVETAGRHQTLEGVESSWGPSASSETTIDNQAVMEELCVPREPRGEKIIQTSIHLASQQQKTFMFSHCICH